MPFCPVHFSRTQPVLINGNGFFFQRALFPKPNKGGKFLGLPRIPGHRMTQQHNVEVRPLLRRIHGEGNEFRRPTYSCNACRRHRCCRLLYPYSWSLLSSVFCHQHACWRSSSNSGSDMDVICRLRDIDRPTPPTPHKTRYIGLIYLYTACGACADADVGLVLYG